MSDTSNGPGSAGESPRYTSVQDYLRVIRRRRRLVIVITALGTLLALAVSLKRDTTYEATAQVLFSDPAQQIQLIAGRNALPALPGPARANINSKLITSPEVARKVKKDLRSQATPQFLQSVVSTQVEFQTNLVDVRARVTSAKSAARIANAFAKEGAAEVTRRARDQIDSVVQQLQAQVDQAKEQFSPLLGRVQALLLQIGQLRALEKVSDPAEIVARAEVPDAPVSPNRAGDTLLGFLVGLVLGLIAAFVRDAFDRRFQNVHEVGQELDLPVVGRVADTAFAHAGLVKNGRPQMTEMDFEAFRVLRANLAFLGGEAPVRSVFVTSGLPGEGKSTVSIALASAAALAGQRVLLIEGDLRRPSFARRLNIPREPGLTDYLMGRASPQEILRTVELTEPARINGTGQPAQRGRVAAMLVCISAGTAVSTSAELLDSDRFRDFVEKVSRAYDLVVFDGSPVLSVADPLAVIPSVDAALLCVRVRRTTRDEARAARHALSQLPDRPLGTVVTGINRSGPDGYDYYYGY